MNSFKFSFLGLVITTLFVTSLMAGPQAINGMKKPYAIEKQVHIEKLSASKSVKVVESLEVYNRKGVVINNDGNTRPDCGEGFVADCSGDGDCCQETWIGDGYGDCEDQQYGCDLTCYDNDGGDCDQGGTTTTTTGGGSCADTFVVAGEADIDGDGYIDNCWTDGSGFYSFTWSGGCLATEITYSAGTLDLTSYGFTEGFFFYGFEPGVTETFTMSFDEGSVVAGEATNSCATCEDLGQVTCWNGDCADTLEDCPAEGECGVGEIADCNGNCAPDYWVGDGYCDDGTYSYNGVPIFLNCDEFDNDGGDCDGTTTTTTTTTTGGECGDGEIVDCQGNCAPDYWVGDGFCDDGTYTYNGIPIFLNCDEYDNDGGDCDGATTTTTTTTTGGDCPAGEIADCEGNCAPESWIGDGYCDDGTYTWNGIPIYLNCDEFNNDGGDCVPLPDDYIATYQATFDWYCYGTPNDGGELRLYADGTAYFGQSSGTWSADNGQTTLGDGLCSGDTFNMDLKFTFDSGPTHYMWTMENGLCSNGSGYHDDTYYNGENVDGLTTLTLLECGDVDPCDGQADGDANADGSVNVLDVVSIVNYILAGGTGLDDCGAAVSDYNGDGSVNVLDVVAIVNMILAGGGRNVDATDATMIQTSNGVDITANGYIGGVQMTLSHGTDFSMDLTDNAYIAEYNTNGNTTTLIVINPEDKNIFNSSGDFIIDEVLVTNSEEFINVARELPLSFTLSNAYPNPFNPTTSLTLDISDQSYASVKVFNLRGEVVGVLLNDMVDAGSYTMTWDATNLSSGVYMIKAEANGQIAAQKVMLVK